MFADHVDVVQIVDGFILILHKNGESIVPRSGDCFGSGMSLRRRRGSGVFEGVSPAVYGVY